MPCCLLQLNNTSIFQNTVNQPSPTIPTPTQMTSKYSFPTPNQMNPMLPSVLTPVGTATTPKTTNPFDSAMVANGLNFTVQQIAAQKANADTPKGATSTSPLNQLNPNNNAFTPTNLQNITHGSSASLDISHSGSLGNLQMGSLAALRSSSADNLLNNVLNNPGTPRNNVSTPKNNTPNNNTPHTPTLATAPSLPQLQPTASIGSLLSFRGLSDPLSNLASGLPRMDSSGLFLPTVPQVPTTPNITRNISELSLLSQGNSHFVPYGGATGFFEPPTPSQNDGTQTPTITTPNLATNNSSAPYAQFQYMQPQQQQNKLKQINNNTITNVNKPIDNNKQVVTDNKKDIKSTNKKATDKKDNKKTGDKDNNELTLMAEGKITVTSNTDPNKNPDGVIKNPKGLTLDLNTEQNDDIDEQVIITPNLMNLNSLTGGGGGGPSLSPQLKLKKHHI